MKVTLPALILATISTMSASVFFYAEAPGVQTSHLGGTVIEDFNSLTPGSLGAYVSPIGSYSSGAQVMAPNIFGGANQTNYIAVGEESGTASYTLTFGGAQSFFGFYWLAMDSANLVQFYNGSTLVGSFSESDVAATLSSAYLGDPNTSTDPSEMFAYIGFLSDNTATNFTSVTFSNSNPGTGFETDNQTILDPPADPPGVTPEPSMFVMIVPALIGLVSVTKRR
jgi:hypothetical protein